MWSKLKYPIYFALYDFFKFYFDIREEKPCEIHYESVYTYL